MLVLDSKSKKPPTVINFQDAAPATYANTSTVGIPGLLSGLWEGHSKFGRLEWAQLVQPAVDLSARGFNVSTQLAFAVQNLPTDSPLRRSSLFFPKGIPLAEGQIIQMPKLAAILSSVAQKGIGEFYGGSAASNLVDFMKISGRAEWALADVQGYKARTEPAVSGTYGKTTIYTSSAPTAGPQLVSMLNILGSSSDPASQFSLQHLHELIETMRLTQNQIVKLGDPFFDAEVNVTLALMMNKTLAEQVAKQIRPNSVLPDMDVPALPHAAASVVTAMDNEDNYVSLVTGLNSIFGAHLEAPGGYLLNDALAGFFVDPALPNSPRHAGQRPLQSFAPVVGTETGGRCGTRFVAGSSDANLLGQVVLNVVQFNQSAFESVRAARIKAEAQSHALTLEDKVQTSLPEEVVAQLIKMGHTVKAVGPPYPSINVVLKIGGNNELDCA